MSELAASPTAAPDLMAQARKEASAALFALAVLQLAFAAACWRCCPACSAPRSIRPSWRQALGWSAGLGTVYLALAHGRDSGRSRPRPSGLGC